MASLDNNPLTKVVLLNFDDLNSTHSYLTCDDFRTALHALCGPHVVKIQLYANKSKLRPSAFVEFRCFQSAQTARARLADSKISIRGVDTVVRAINSTRQSIDIDTLKQHGKDYVSGVGEGRFPLLKSWPADQQTGQVPKRPRTDVPPPGFVSGPAGGLMPSAASVQPQVVVGAVPTPSPIRKAQDGRSLFVKNLPNGIGPEVIFRLFGTCGNVKGVKLHFNNRSQCFVQFFRPDGGARAVEYLNSCVLWGRPLHVEFAANNRGTGALKMEPMEEATDKEGAELELFFGETSDGQRFEPGRDTADVAVARPGPTIRIDDISIHQDQREFANYVNRFWRQGDETPVIRWAVSDRDGFEMQSCTVTFANVYCAVSALVGFHSVVLNETEGRALSVTFCETGDQPPAHYHVSSFKGIFIPDPTIVPVVANTDYSPYEEYDADQNHHSLDGVYGS
eukprot:gene14573-22290_t